MTKFAAAVLFASFAATSAAHSQQVVEPGGGRIVDSESKALTYRADGKLVGCGVEFVVVYQDHVYRNGALSGLSGSLNMFYTKGKTPSVAFKVNGVDVQLGGTPPAQPFHVHHSYVVANGRSLAGTEHATFRCENGGFCAAYPFSPSMDALTDNTLAVAYNRKAAGMDVTVPINFIAKDADAEEYGKFADCFAQLTARFRVQD